MKTPGEVVQTLIKDHHTTQVQVAIDMGYSPHQVHKVCKGQRQPSPFFVVKFAEALGIDPEPVWRSITECQLAVAKREAACEGVRREKSRQAGNDFKVWVASRS